MRKLTLLALSALSIAALSPAIAQDAMMKDGMKSGSMKKMSAADMKMMKNCKAMSRDRMMKNARCAAMMKAHPDMMKQDAMMKKGG